MLIEVVNRFTFGHRPESNGSDKRADADADLV